MLRAMTFLVRNDYSFSDYGLGESFYNLSLLSAPFTNEVVVSKQMIRTIALEPLFNTFTLGGSLEYLCGDASLTERPGKKIKNINFGALLANENSGAPQVQLESPLEHLTHLALQMSQHGNYTHAYKRERDFNLEGACMHLVSIGRTDDEWRIPAVPMLQQRCLMHSNLLVNLQQVLVYI